MISLPTFFQKNKPDTRAHRQEPSFRARSNASSVLEDTQALEDREVQKSRHRLLGASLLLLIAVIGLPKLFDAESKKLNNDVVIQVTPQEQIKTSRGEKDGGIITIPDPDARF